MASKRFKNALKQYDASKTHSLVDGVATLQKFPKTKFDETVEVALHLGVDPRQSDQMVRGTVPLPNGSGKNVRVLVFAKDGPAADAAKAAGAEHVGYEEYLKKCTEGWVDFDVAIATPEAMLEVRKLGKVLGPRGLMPNPKTGTVTEDTGKAVREVKAGRVEFKLDKSANLHITVGKRSFSSENLVENIRAALDAVLKAKPSGARGTFVTSCHLSSTMSPSVRVDLREVAAGVV